MKKRTLLLFLALLCLLGAGCYGAALLAHQDETIATVIKDGEVLYRFHLDTVTETRTYTIGEDGAQNIIEVSPDGIAVTKADCPDQTCVHQGVRKHGPTPIVCLPHDLSIRFSSDDGTDLDATTGQ